MKTYTDEEVVGILAAGMRAAFNAGAGRQVEITPQDMDQYRIIKSALATASEAVKGDTRAAIKAGARHSANDQQAIQAAHDQLVSAGAVCGATKAWTPPLAIKSVGGGVVEGLLVRYTDPNHLDLQRDYFNRTSDFELQDGQELPLLWHHDLDPEKRGPIGKGVVKFTDLGLWFKSWLNRRDAYEALILKLIEMGKAGYSSGADESRVVRQPVAGKARASLIVKWPIFEGSITPTPMDPGNQVSLKAFLQGDRGARIKKELRQLEERCKRDLLLELEAIEDEHTRTQRILAELREIEGR